METAVLTTEDKVIDTLNYRIYNLYDTLVKTYLFRKVGCGKETIKRLVLRHAERS